MVKGQSKAGESRGALSGSKGIGVHVVLAAVPVVIAVIAACSSASDDGDDEAGSDTSAADSSETTDEPEDFIIQAEDFVRLREMTPIRGFFIDNHLGHLDEAIAVAENPEGGVYPVGTVIQLVPQEAMVKRAPGFDPASNDWELFALEVSEEGTTIVERGGAEVVNQFGGLSCVECHSKAEPQWDFVCEKDHGCDPLPISDDIIEAFQEDDPR